MNGNIGTGDAAVLALLADTARAGRGWGGGYWGGGLGGEGGGYGGYGGAFATPSSLQHSMNCLSQQGQEQSNSLRNSFAQAGLRDSIGGLSGQFAGAEQRVADLFNLGNSRITEQLTATQINTLRESADLSRQIAACCCETQKNFLEQALKQQECCCETQKIVFQENQKTRDLICQNELRQATDANNVSSTVNAINSAAAQNTAAIIAAIQGLNGGHHHGRP